MNSRIPVLQTGPLTAWVPRRYVLIRRLMRPSITMGDCVPAFFIRLLMRSFRVRSTCSAFRCSSTRRTNSNASDFVRRGIGLRSTPNASAMRRGSIDRFFGGTSLTFLGAIETISTESLIEEDNQSSHLLASVTYSVTSLKRFAIPPSTRWRDFTRIHSCSIAVILCTVARR